jgi:hypothetical protein
VASHGIPAAHTNVIETPDYWFLESERFDRSGVRGRIAVLSLAAVHDDLADSWARAAMALKEARRLSDEDARRLSWLDAFGALIANTDRHQYNILFFTEGARLRLAPAFDQVSMLYAPTGDGQVPPRALMLPPVTADALDPIEPTCGSCRFASSISRDASRRETLGNMRSFCCGMKPWDRCARKFGPTWELIYKHDVIEEPTLRSFVEILLREKRHGFLSG